MSFLERPFNEVRVKRVCKSCIREHSDNTCQITIEIYKKSDLTKYMASSLAALNTCLRFWNSLGAFESNWWGKCLWDWCVCEPFLSMNTKLPLFTLKLLFPVERENRKTSLAKSGPLDFPSEKSFLLFFAYEKGLGHMFQKYFSCSPILFFYVPTSQKWFLARPPLWTAIESVNFKDFVKRAATAKM